MEIQQDKCWLQREVWNFCPSNKMNEVEKGKGDKYLECSNLFTVCQRHRGFSDEESTKFEQYCFLTERMSLL